MARALSMGRRLRPRLWARPGPARVTERGQIGRDPQDHEHGGGERDGPTLHRRPSQPEPNELTSKAEWPSYPSSKHRSTVRMKKISEIAERDGAKQLQRSVAVMMRSSARSGSGILEGMTIRGRNEEIHGRSRTSTSGLPDGSDGLGQDGGRRGPGTPARCPRSWRWTR